ncbi:uncharacterized protein N7459_005716 [Penicillium hispanicum]|uniref:uncharacterized protein n=1 Tax=Penicillium hispanicum TaxID=1080232 RepID=UPI0025421562|nr:uncharacterized protein N7459_005716 [Penicillium hispanicum]KAJ5579731.1 hypothetical protein N7459_005716 [Penicillium hispanicum]
MSLHGLGVIGAQVAASIKSNDEKHTASPTIRSPVLSLQSTPDLGQDARLQEFDPSVGAKPYSPFYAHSTPTTSYEQLTFETKAADHNLSNLRDVENAVPYSVLGSESPRRSKLWEPENPSRSCLDVLSSRQRMTLKIIIAVITVGGMIGIALGITAAVGGAAWKDSTEKALSE